MTSSLLLAAVALALAAYLAFSPRLAASSDWKATVAPLASIMGSGFLISAPMLAGAVGNGAILSMAGLLALAYLAGDAIRFNIRRFEPIEHDSLGPAQDLAFASRIALSGSYFISVCYYLQLLAAFVLEPLGIRDPAAAHGLATALLMLIGGVGLWRGLAELEKVERFAVGLNLGVIAALLVGLFAYNARLLWTGEWALPHLSTEVGFGDLRVVLGLLIVVQGFEIARYLGDEHSADRRVRTMRNAQRIAAAIYLVFIALATVLFRGGLGSDVTAIVEMTRPVASVLPPLLAIAAVGSQFSAATADYAGVGGLLEDLSGRRLSARFAYALVLVVTVALTWETDVKQIIAYASRSFALYYALQAAVAFAVVWQTDDVPRRSLRLAEFASVTAACLVVFLLGLPAE
jgi:hypothetical protein